MSPTFTLFCFLVSLHGVASQGKPPDITDPPVQQIKYIVEDGNFNFTCKADGNPAPKYKWYVNGKEIESNKYQKVNADSGVLEIHDFSRREAGDYRCGATNNISQGVSPLAISPAISLKEIQQATGWSESDDTEDVRVTEGEYVKLECNNVTQGDPKHPFSWFLKSSDADQLQESDRTYIDERGTLHFIHVEVSDKTSGDDVYNCAIYNRVRNYVKLGNSKRLTVTKHTGSRERKPKKQFHTNPAEFLIGQTAELECVFSGNPQPSIYWFDTKNEPIGPGTKYQMDHNNMKLKITKITEKDEGNYRCKGENAHGEAEATIFLDVKSAPIWEKAIINLTVPEGRDASFTCKARPSIGEKALKAPVWYKNWEKIERNTDKFLFSEEGRVLTVTQLTKPHDIMCFQCQITNDVGSVFSNGCLNVIKPIRVTTQPPLRQAIKKGDLVNLTVRGTTDPGMTLRYRWEFKTQTHYTELPPYVTYDDATNQTYINTTSLSDEEYEQIHGNYTRLLYHDFENRSVVISVVRRRDPEQATGWSKRDDIEDVRVTEGEYAKLECNNLTRGDPKSTFSWFLKTSSYVELQGSDRTYIDERGTLHFMYVEVSDKTSGDDVYYCAIYNKVQEYIKLGNSKRLTVTKHTGSRERKPKKQFQTNPAEFLIGQTAELECVFSGYPRPSIYWFDTKNEPIGPGTKYQMDHNNMKLKITKITEKDEGNYRCKGENTHGEAEATIFLDVKSAPIWEKAITDLTVPEGRDASFTCKARLSIGEKALKAPVWYKNWEKIERNTDKFLFSEEGRVLTVTQLTKSHDIMCFQCQITNDVGSVFSNGCLNVIKPIRVTTQPPLRQAIKKGDLVNLTVRGTTDPGMTLRYRWEFKTQIYYTELPPYVTYDDATNQTYINTTSLSDEEYEQIHGNYTRLLYHDFENRSVVISVVRRRDPAPIVLQAVFPWSVIVVMVAVVVVILVQKEG